MNVRVLGHEQSLRDIAQDARTLEAVAIVRGHPELLGLLFSILRRFHKVVELEHGKDNNGNTLQRVVSGYPVRATLLTSRTRLSELVADLYGSFTPGEGRVRGAILEAIVEHHLQQRYGRDRDLLENNLKFALGNGSTRYSSGEKSIDVMGFDGVVGECHDCKVHPKFFQRGWVNELQTDVAPTGLKIGLVTAAGSRAWAERNLSEAGIVVSPSTTIVTAEDFHPLIPLQPE